MPSKIFSLVSFLSIEDPLCPALPSTFNHGTITVSGQKSGDAATYKCKQGYNLKGTAARTCEINGTKAEWSPATPPTCQGKNNDW